LVYRHLFTALWLSWGATWWALSRHVSPATRQESVASRLAHLVPLMVALWLLAMPRLPLPPLDSRWLLWRPWTFWLGAMLTTAGLLFSVWARLHLGRHWSATVTLKQGHELITSGPYALVRHPIYTGLLLGFVGSAIALGEVRGLLAVAIVFAALWRKLRLEERWMVERFGPSYQAYAGRVAALVPWIV
jgi:protein-S-isoprenylcysteine O-methyltransferase Ste14